MQMVIKAASWPRQSLPPHAVETKASWQHHVQWSTGMPGIASGLRSAPSMLNQHPTRA
jgi:hypothetical protein